MHTTTMLPMPTNDKAFILHTLLNKGTVSERDFQMNGYRMRISELHELGVPMKFREKDFTNQFGRSRKYRERYIEKNNMQKAIEIYMAINKEKTA